MSLVLLALSVLAHAVRPPGVYPADTFSLSAGLPGSDVRAIELTGDGRLMIGTDLGLTVFDGQDFTPQPSPSLWSAAFIHAVISHNGVTYVQCDRGLYAVIDDLAVIIDEHAQFSPAQFFIASDGVLLASDQGVQRIQRSGEGFSIQTIASIPARSVIMDDQTIWFGSETGLYRTAGEDVIEVASVPVRRFLSSSSGLLVGREDGLFSLNGEEIPVSPGCFVTDMTQLLDGRVVLACGDGVRIGRPGGEWETIDTSSGLPGPVVTAVTIDRHGLLWIGTYGNGLVRLNSLDVLVWNRDSSLFSNQITTMVPDGEGLLIGGLGGAIRVEADFSVTTLPVNLDVRQIVRGRTGDLFTLSHDGVTRSGEGGQNLIAESAGRYGALYREPRGDILLFSPTTGSAIRLDPDIGPVIRVDPDLTTAELRPGPGGVLWGAGQEELWRLDEDGFVSVGSGPGACRNGTISVVEEVLYVSCSRGVFRHKEGNWRQMMAATERPIAGLLTDGSTMWSLAGDRLFRLLPDRMEIGLGHALPMMRLITGQSAASFSGWLVGIAEQGVLWMRQGAFARAAVAPTPRIEALLLRGEPVVDPMALAASDTFLEVRAGSDFLGSVAQNRWRYRLDRSDWSPSQQSARIHLPGLTPGEHTVSVQVAAKGSGWSEAVTTGFRIARPLWTQPGLWAAVFGVFTMIGGLVWRERERLLREKLRELEAREALQKTFGQYVNEKVAQAAVSGAINEDGELRRVTVLFADIRGFTPLSQQLEPKELLGLLNDWLSVVVEEVEGRGGIINKFLGDAVVAVFGVPEELENHAEHATRAAAALIRATREMGPELRARYGRSLHISVGINTGTAVAGPVGTASRREYTIIGEAVNIAARVEALTRTLKVDVLLTEATAHHLIGQHPLTEQGEHRLTGLRDPVMVWSLEA